MSITDLLSALFRIFPRLTVVPSTHGGVLYRRGKPRVVQPETLLLWWPIWSELLLAPVVRQTLNLPVQVIAPQGVPVALSAVVVYSIKDPLVLTRVHDLDDAIRDMALVAVRDAVEGVDTSEAWYAEIDAELAKCLKARLRGWGVAVEKVALTDVAPCQVIRCIGGDTVVPVKNGYDA